MAQVQVIPMPERVKKYSRRYWPLYPPIFVPGTGAVTRADMEYALELLEALDPESQEWYRGAAARIREQLDRSGD